MQTEINQDSGIRDVLEALLFVSKKPLSIGDFHEVLGFGEDNIQNAMDQLVSQYQTKGLQLIKLANGYVMATRPEHSEFINKYLNSPVSVTLTNQALETLSIIAYKQPVTKLEVDNIRGVMSDAPIRTLLEKRLIKEAGKADRVGHPILYATTVEFLKHFGLHDLSELPLLNEELASKMAAQENADQMDENISEGGIS